MKILKPLFWTLIFLIPFEIYKLDVIQGILSLRPYQIIEFILLIFLAFYYFKRKIKPKELLVPFRSPISKLLAVYFVVSLISLINSPDLKNGIQETLVLLSFLAIYWLVLFFIRTSKDVKNIFIVIIASGVMTAIIGLVQTLAYKFGLELIEVMPGRPNSILPEPDWFGLFMVFVFAVLLSLQYTIKSEDEVLWINLLKNKYVYYIIQCLFFVSIILALARASWLAGIALIGLYVFLIFIDKNNHFSLAFIQGTKILTVFLISLGIIYVFGLTPFSLKNRFLSIATGEEIHAVIIDKETGKEITIKKEKVKEYKNKGIEVIAKKVNDINFLKRKESFSNNSDIILKHPLLGIGFGGISSVFGQGVNASNIFMEIWIATGVIGLIIFGLIFYLIFREWLVFFIKKRGKNNQPYLFFIILGLVVIIIPNIFNSGLFLGFFWVYLGIAANLLDHQLYG